MIFRVLTKTSAKRQVFQYSENTESTTGLKRDYYCYYQDKIDYRSQYNDLRRDYQPFYYPGDGGGGGGSSPEDLSAWYAGGMAGNINGANARAEARAAAQERQNAFMANKGWSKYVDPTDGVNNKTCSPRDSAQAAQNAFMNSGGDYAALLENLDLYQLGYYDITDFSKYARIDYDGIYSLRDGEVVAKYSFAKDYKGAKGYGIALLIQNTDGILALYAHLADGSIDHLNIGDKVTAGQKIAIMGSSGTRTADGQPNRHLHLSLFAAGTDYSGWANGGIFTAAKPGANKSITESFYNTYIGTGCFPTNTKRVTDGFYGSTNGYSYPHEGWDFSGRIDNLISGWQNGIYKHTP